MQDPWKPYLSPYLDAIGAEKGEMKELGISDGRSTSSAVSQAEAVFVAGATRSLATFCSAKSGVGWQWGGGGRVGAHSVTPETPATPTATSRTPDPAPGSRRVSRVCVMII